MDVREKLVEIIQNSVGGCARHWAEVIADGLISHGVTVQDNTEISDELLERLRKAPVTVMTEEPTVEAVQEWISVKDRLPEDFAQVLICSVIGNQYVAQHLRGHFYSDGINIGTSHWMPLPQPPKGE